MKNNKVEANKPKAPMTSDKKMLIIILSSVAAALLIALIPIIIILVNNSKPDPDSDKGHNIPESVLSGSYIMEVPASISKYTFSEGNKLTNIYSSLDTDGVDGDGNLSDVTPDIVETEYTYRIVKQDGKDYIELTDVKTDKVTLMRFQYGSQSRDYYRCENENCIINKTNDGRGYTDDPRVDGSEYCTSHPDSKIYVASVERKWIAFGEEDAEAVYHKLENQE